MLKKYYKQVPAQVIHKELKEENIVYHDDFENLKDIK